MKLEFTKKIEIQKSASEVYSIISDLKNWNAWSPWYHCEPTCKTVLEGSAGEGQTQTWEGQVIGAGKMTIDKLEKNKSMMLKLEFFKPWKGLSWAKFDLNETSPGKTQVSWTLDSSLPFFMFFFKNMMMAYMGNDFDRGLRMLKDLCESGTVWAKSEYKGEKNYDEFYVVGKKTSCPISDISTHIRNDFMAIDTLLKQQKLSTPEGMITVSHVHDIPKGVCTFTAGLIYKSKDGVTIPAGYEIFKIDSHKGLAVDHYGPYRHIGNAWSMAVSYQRGLKKKVSKTPPAYEIYKTIPGQVAEKDLYTQITMPIK